MIGKTIASTIIISQFYLIVYSFLFCYKIVTWHILDDPDKKSTFLRKHMESESEIRDMLKTPKYKTAAELVSGIYDFFNKL